jgi:uncharacterized Ntn-hydrolase superfamily protein
MTFSIVARAPDGSHFGVAIASSSPAVAARCTYAKSGVGAVASQNLTNPVLGPAVLSLLERGAATHEAIDTTFAAEPYRDYRQLLAIGRHGAAAIRSGTGVLGVHGKALGDHAAAAGNLLAHTGVPAAMVAAFEAARGSFGTRLLAALRAAVSEGGEAGPIHSAGLYIVRDVPWPIVDLRVDWLETDPVLALASTYEIYAPQIEAYVQRARDPSVAPGFSVPGAP